MSAAEKLLSVKGYSDTTVRRIADEVGILSGSIYHYFRSKDEIFKAIVEPYISARKKAVLSAFHSGSGFLETVANMATVQLTHVLSNQAVSAILIDETKILLGSEKFSFVRHADADLFHAWRDLLSTAVYTGKLHDEIDCGLVARSIMTLIDNSARLTLSSDVTGGAQPSSGDDRLVDQLSAMVFGLISPWAKMS